AALWFQDERAMLVSLVVEAILYAGASHLTASRERIASVDPAVRRAALSYGLPLMVNGLGLLVLSQLDRYIVANLFGLETLALYALVLNLALMAISPVNIVANKLGIPYLVRSRDNPIASRQAALLVAWVMVVGGALYAMGVGLFLDWFVPLLYGAHYQ